MDIDTAEDNEVANGKNRPAELDKAGEATTGEAAVAEVTAPAGKEFEVAPMGLQVHASVTVTKLPVMFSVIVHCKPLQVTVSIMPSRPPKRQL
ncbi:unnamed protein product [Umbelopsis vinacea]